MNIKMIAMIGAILLIIAVAGGVGWKLTQKAEGYKATGDQFNMRAEPRFGCATLKVYFYGKDSKEVVNSPDSGNSK
mgnify:CR=1 FL=1